jgi:ketosteroid isomerase-like protein
MMLGTRRGANDGRTDMQQSSSDPSAPRDRGIDTLLAQEIERMLAAAASAWNAGNLAAFLDYYDRSPTTCYVSGAQIVIGYKDIERIYNERLAAIEANEWGTLAATLLCVEPLGSGHALAIGRYVLKRDAAQGPTHQGTFSLVLRRTGLGWRIALDHTSG